MRDVGRINRQEAWKECTMNDINTVLPHLRLRFNIDHPELEECYSLGYECALAEVEEGENPFVEGTLEYEHWQEGWWAGFYGEEPLHQLPAKPVDKKHAANEGLFFGGENSFMSNVLKITGVIATSALIGYQLLDLVA